MKTHTKSLFDRSSVTLKYNVEEEALRSFRYFCENTQFGPRQLVNVSFQIDLVSHY
jgi:hypothetical protein